MGESITREEMVTLFVGLIKDSEGEVKILAIGQAPGEFQIICSSKTYSATKLYTLAFAKRIDQSVVIEKILPCIKDLVIDTNQHVRAAVATNISGLAPILGKDL